ncbi:hypothetical protein KM043_013941 [Ampulex compressa]|nr:hypothetical protein KM043_013941 [Ampulex compressa]
MHQVGAILALLLGLCAHIYASELDYDGWLQLRLWHALNDDPMPVFVERGNVTVSSLRSSASFVGQNGLLQSQIEQLKALAVNNAKYRLKAIARTSSGSESTFLTSVPACHLLGSDLEDTIIVWLDSGAEPAAISVSAFGPCALNSPFTNIWTTSIVVKYPDAGPAPDTAIYVRKLEREREARERGETKDNRSFVGKYWMYIVPVLIFVVLSSATNPEAGGGSGGSGGGGGGSAQRQ